MGVSRRNSTAVAVALLAALVLAIPVFAKPDRAAITLTRTCQAGSASLPAGNYQMLFDGNKVSFLHNGKMVAEITGEWRKAPAKVESTSVSYEANGRIIEIRLQGRDSYLAVQ